MANRRRLPADFEGAGRTRYSSRAVKAAQAARSSEIGGRAPLIVACSAYVNVPNSPLGFTLWSIGSSIDKQRPGAELFQVRFCRLSRVGVAQHGRALDCGSSGRGFKSHRSPSSSVLCSSRRAAKAYWRGRAALRDAVPSESETRTGPLAQLVEQRTLNPSVEGSIPSRLIVGCLVKLVDTLALGASTLTGVRVRVSGQPLQGTRTERSTEAFGNIQR